MKVKGQGIFWQPQFNQIGIHRLQIIDKIREQAAADDKLIKSQSQADIDKIKAHKLHCPTL